MIAHRWAALAFAVILIPDHHVATGLGHAQALALRVIPVVVSSARGSGHTDPITLFGRPVGVSLVGWFAVGFETFAAACFSIIILVSNAF